MNKRLNAQLLIDGEPLADDVQLDVFICDQCDGKGRVTLTLGWSLDGDGKLEWNRNTKRCDKCRGSGFVIYLSRPEKAEVPS